MGVLRVQMAAEAGNDEARSRKIAELLDAALPEFARAGLEGARVDTIARAAGMNKRLLYHYVGDKAALFDATLDVAYDRILGAEGGFAHADLAGQGDEWRMICHGVAGGRPGRLKEIGSQAGAGSAGAAAVGLRLLTGLLPELADQLLGNAEGDEAGRRQALSGALKGLQSPAVKPRLKLRPDLRSGGAA